MVVHPYVLLIVGDQLFHALHIEAVYSQSRTYSQSGQEWQVRRPGDGVGGGGGGGEKSEWDVLYYRFIILFS